MSTLLSVIVPVYNTPSYYLRKLIYSLIKDKPSNTEIIFIDDGSKAYTAKLLDEFADKYTYIHSIHQDNAGQNAARKTGVNLARGQFIMFCDSDDEFRWTRMLPIINSLRHNEADAFIFNSSIINEQGVEKPGYGNTWFTLENCRHDIKRYALSQCAEVWRNVFRKELLTDDIFCTESKIGEDIAVVFLALTKAKTVKTFDCAPYLYRVTEEGIEHKAPGSTRLHIKDVFDFILSHIDDDSKSQYSHELEWEAILHVMCVEINEMLKTNTNQRYIKELCSWMETTFPNWRKNPYLKIVWNTIGLRSKLILRHHFATLQFLRSCKSILNIYFN